MICCFQTPAPNYFTSDSNSLQTTYSVLYSNHLLLAVGIFWHFINQTSNTELKQYTDNEYNSKSLFDSEYQWKKTLFSKSLSSTQKHIVSVITMTGLGTAAGHGTYFTQYFYQENKRLKVTSVLFNPTQKQLTYWLYLIKQGTVGSRCFPMFCIFAITEVQGFRIRILKC